MATGQDLLNQIEVLYPESQNQPGESSVTLSLRALNMAQDYMESLFALQPDLLGDGTGTVVTAAQTEKTTFPAGLLRLDRIQFLDATTLRPVYDLRDIRRTAGHVQAQSWPMNLVATAGAQPQAYWTDGSNFYWSPLPDAVYTLRWYGFQAKADITASGAFGYPDVCMTPLAVFATRILRTGTDDDTSALVKLGTDLFNPVVTALSKFQREHAPGFNYRYSHNT